MTCKHATCDAPKAAGRGRQYCAHHQTDAREQRRRSSIERVHQWRQDNLEHHRMVNRVNRYGLSVDEYLDMLDFQDGRCGICRTPGGLKLEIDHDHHTGKVRGLLCGACNSLLGLARDNVLILDAAASYLATPVWKQASDIAAGNV